MSFAEELADNTKQAMVNALLRTAVSDPNRTIGEIQDALENEVKAPYMPGLFKGVTVGQLVQATAVRIREMGLQGQAIGERPATAPTAPVRGDTPEWPAPVGPASGADEDVPKKKKKKKGSKRSAPPRASEIQEDEGPEDDLEDEGGDDGGSYGVEGLPKKKKKKKDKGEPSKKGKDDGDGHLSLVDPNDQKAYQSAIVKLLRRGKCVDINTGMSSTEIRKELGGNPKQFRDNVDVCVIAERCHKAGEARGVRYFIGQ
jgi:hypothetical protein